MRCRPPAAWRRDLGELEQLACPSSSGRARRGGRGRSIFSGSDALGLPSGPRPLEWTAGGCSSLVHNVGQRSPSGCGGWWGGGNCGLHQRSRLLPPLAAAPRGPAAPAAGNAPALDGGSRPWTGAPGPDSGHLVGSLGSDGAKTF